MQHAIQPDTRPSILIAEDHSLFGESLRIGLENTGRFPGIRHVKNGQLAVAAVAAQRPDVILMDILMPEMNGLEAAYRIKQADPSIRIIMLTSLTDEKTLRTALSAGVDGYAAKTVSLDDLAHVIEVVMAGIMWLDPAIAKQTLANLTHAKPKPVPAATPAPIANPAGPDCNMVLTQRDLQILSLIADYKTNKEIAEILKISEAWIQGYVRNIVQKLAVDNEVEAVRKAVTDGTLPHARILDMAESPYR